jgi:hypothetical protein
MREMAKEAGAFDTNVLNISKLGIAVVANRLGRIARSAQQREQIVRAMEEQMARGELIALDHPALDPNVTDVDSKELLDLAMAAQRFDDMSRRILGVIDPDQLDQTEQAQELSVSARMHADDVDRLAVAIGTLQQIGMFPQVLELTAGDEDEADVKPSDVVDADPVELAKSQQDELQARRDAHADEREELVTVVTEARTPPRPIVDGVVQT